MVMIQTPCLPIRSQLSITNFRLNTFDQLCGINFSQVLLLLGGLLSSTSLFDLFEERSQLWKSESQTPIDKEKNSGMRNYAKCCSWNHSSCELMSGSFYWWEKIVFTMHVFEQWREKNSVEPSLVKSYITKESGP